MLMSAVQLHFARRLQAQRDERETTHISNYSCQELASRHGLTSPGTTLPSAPAHSPDVGLQGTGRSSPLQRLRAELLLSAQLLCIMTARLRNFMPQQTVRLEMQVSWRQHVRQAPSAGMA